MPYLPLTQDPLSAGLKNASDEGRELFVSFVEKLNEYLTKEGYDKIWYQPDDSVKWAKRYFWMFYYESDKRDFITRLNFESRNTFQIQFSHFGAKIPNKVEFLPPNLTKNLKYKGFPGHVLISSNDNCNRYAPLVAEHYFRIQEHLANGGKLPLRGCSHLEIALKSYLKIYDSAKWDSWDKPEFLGRREVDLSCKSEKIAIEIQGDYWHRREGQPERDEIKKQDLLSNGWSVIWAWESGIKEKFRRVIDALEQIRSGEQFVEIKK